MQRTYVMSDRIYRTILRRRKADKILCQRCGREIKPGDEVLAKLATNGRFKYYHKECYESLWLDL